MINEQQATHIHMSLKPAPAFLPPTSLPSRHSQNLLIRHSSPAHPPYCAVETPSTSISTRRSTNSVRGTRSNPYQITLLPGDGLGPQSVASTVRMLQTLSTVTDVHFKFTEQPDYNSNCSNPINEQLLSKCKDGDGVVLRGAAGMDRRKGVGLARGLMEGLGLSIQIRPGTMYEWQGLVGGDLEMGMNGAPTNSGPIELNKGLMDVMLVREVGGGAMRGEGIREDRTDYEKMESAKSEIMYMRKEIKNVVEWAVKIAGMRGGRLVNVDKADVMNVSRFWRTVVHETFEKVTPNVESVQLMDIYVDDFAREIILNPTAFDTVLTSNLFGDVLAEVIGALAGPARIAPAAWLAADGTAVYGPADVYNPCAYSDLRGGVSYLGETKDPAKPTAANLIAMYRAASMLLRYSLEEPAAADIIRNALGKVMTDLVGRHDVGRQDKSISMIGEDENAVVQSTVDMIDGEEFETEFDKQINYIRQYELVCDPGECGE